MKKQRIEEILSGADSKNLLVFLDAEGLSAFPMEDVCRGKVSPVLAVRTEELAECLSGQEQVLRSDQPDFVDRLKLLSEGKGFPLILVLDRDPAAVRQALGAAKVLGTVYLGIILSGPVTVDLHTTINYKSLVVKGAGG